MFGFSKPQKPSGGPELDLAVAQLRENLHQMRRANVLLQEQYLHIEHLTALLVQHENTVQMYTEEVSRLNAQDLEQMERLTAYARWCDKQGCAPTDADLDEMIRG